VNVFNNLIFNNVTGLAGGGISLQDATRVRIVHNTIARNDSAATAADAFEGGLAAPTTPQVGGIVSRAHSRLLAAALAGDDFSQPELLRNNIIWENRSFFWSAADGLQPRPAGLHWDLGVVGTGNPAHQMDPRQCLLTDETGFDPSNIEGDPAFVEAYENVLRTAAAADEGGNFVQVLYHPLAGTGDYHITSGSAARNATDRTGLGAYSQLAKDYDGNNRPQQYTDMGGDERVSSQPSRCGLGFELVALVAPLYLFARRRAQRSGRDVLPLLALLLAGGVAAPGASQAAAFVQCPGDTDGDAVIDDPGAVAGRDVKC
jgi:hypothetical protein